MHRTLKFNFTQAYIMNKRHKLKSFYKYYYALSIKIRQSKTHGRSQKGICNNGY